MTDNEVFSLEHGKNSQKNIQSSFGFEKEDLSVKKQIYNKKLKPNKNQIKYYDHKSELPILFSYNDLLLYVYKIFEKIKTHKVLVDSILNELSICHKQLYLAKSYKDKSVKYKCLLSVDASVNYLNASMRNIRKLKLISTKNYTVWSYKIVEIDESLQKWMINCQK